MGGALPAKREILSYDLAGERARNRPARGPQRKSGSLDLRSHKKTDPGQARDRRTLLELQFHE
jgi:hypothetical protein